MSIFTVNEVCYRLVHDPPFSAAMKRDAAAALRAEDLTDRERELILTGDVVALYRLGAHPFLLGHLARYGIGGLSVPLYSERIRTLAEPAHPAKTPEITS